MTREQIEGYVAKWIPRLRLHHWDIFVDWEATPKDPDAAADSQWAWSYDHCALRFAANHERWTERYAETTVVHELLHLVFRDIEVAASNTHETLRGPARVIAEKQMEHEIEGVVDRVAAMLVALSTP